jgi:hypothetical protein
MSATGWNKLKQRRSGITTRCTATSRTRWETGHSFTSDSARRCLFPRVSTASLSRGSLGRIASPSLSMKSQFALPCHPEPASTTCFTWGYSRSSRGRLRLIHRPCRPCIMARLFLSRHVLCVTAWLVGCAKFWCNGRASRQLLQLGRTSSCYAPSTQLSSSRTSWSLRGREMSWSGARTPDAAGPVTCAMTRNVQSARYPVDRDRNRDSLSRDRK